MKKVTVLFLFYLLALVVISCDDGDHQVECGNGVVEEGEQCDSGDLGGSTCQSEGYATGLLSCDGDCTLNLEMCSNSVCNNGAIEEGESCDGTLLGGATCQDYGFYFGELNCDETCQFDLSACQLPDSCGNGTVDPDEECDGNELAEQNCGTLGFAQGGSLGCTDTCLFDVSNCVVTQRCGNGVVDPRENCDGTVDPFTDCTALGYSSGTEVFCSNTCTFDVSGCSGCAGVSPNYSCDVNNDECCPKDGQPYACGAGPWNQTFCNKACVDTGDCGFIEDCYTAEGICSFKTCLQFPAPCLLNDGTKGHCIPSGLAMNSFGLCVAQGAIRAGQECVPVEYGEFPYEPLQLCLDGYCATTDDSTEVTRCVKYCDALLFIDTGVDSCPVGYNCLNFTDLDWDNEYGYRYFRYPDVGACQPMFDGMEGAGSKGQISCDLLEQKQLKTGLACPDEQLCGVYSMGTLMGVCRESSVLNKALSETCDPAAEVPECGAGLSCMESDPLGDPASGHSCLQICDARTENDNVRCEGLGGGVNHICLTASRFFTDDHELPSSNNETEAAPSPLGFCVPAL